MEDWVFIALSILSLSIYSPSGRQTKHLIVIGPAALDWFLSVSIAPFRGNSEFPVNSSPGAQTVDTSDPATEFSSSSIQPSDPAASNRRSILPDPSENMPNLPEDERTPQDTADYEYHGDSPF